ncbi:MAG TPA: hypothetical protein VH253_03710 [Phycisphaerae bacterium]|nr:hypothetical protein [Phycisphaerae bacterium]
MTRALSQVRPVAAGDGAAAPGPGYTGFATYLYAFDIAYEMDRVALSTLLGQPVGQFQMDVSKRAPRQLFFYRPQMVRLPPLERIRQDGGLVRIERQVKLFAVGAISLTFKVAFGVKDLAELVHYHDMRFTNGSTIYEEALATAEEVRKELLPRVSRPVERLADEEAYTVFCITSPVCDTEGTPKPAEQWLAAHRREVAALLTEEPVLSQLSEQEAEESTSRYLSYYDRDLVVIDWDAALVVDEARYVDEMVYLLELANLQLAELEAYDRLLDNVIDRAYRDLTPAGLRGGWRRPRRWSGTKTLRDLREIRIDLARMSDELSNITKFFGDWHLARSYQAVASRFHLGDWHHTIDEKLKTLDDLYQLLQADRNHRTVLILELTMVVLFVLDLLMLFRVGK